MAEKLAREVAGYRLYVADDLAELEVIQGVTLRLLDAIKARNPALLDGVDDVTYHTSDADCPAPHMEIVWDFDDAILIVQEHSVRVNHAQDVYYRTAAHLPIGDIDGICATLEKLLEGQDSESEKFEELLVKSDMPLVDEDVD
jgi:hypothetical protein